MEEQTQANPQSIPPQEDTPSVGFPEPKEPSGGKSKLVKWIVVLVGIIAIIAVGAWFIMQDVSTEDTAPENNSGSELSNLPTQEPTPTPEPTPTEEAEPVDKSEVRIEVLNGTGTPGDAGYLQGELEDIGFEDIDAGNADDQGETTTTATFSRELSAPIVDEITEKLEELYEDVSTRKSTLGDDYDVRIVTGTRKDATSTTADTTEDTSEEDTTETSEDTTEE